MKRVSADLPFPRSITESSRAAGAADLIRIYDGGGTSSVRRCRCLQAKEAPSSRSRTDPRSPPTGTYRRANTTRPWEVGRGSTFLVVAPYRKARVVAPACRRICPRFSVPSGEKPTKNQRLRFGFRSCFGRLRSIKLCRNWLKTLPGTLKC